MRITTLLVAAAVLCVPALSEVPTPQEHEKELVHRTNAAFTQRSVPGPNKSRRASTEGRSTWSDMSTTNDSVLIVDDDASVRTGLGRFMRCASYSVATFSAAQKFLPAAIPRQCYGDDGTIIYRQTGDVMKL